MSRHPAPAAYGAGFARGAILLPPRPRRPRPDPDEARRPGRPSRVPVLVSLLALALGGLAIGTTEFASMGVLPLYAADLGVSVPGAGAAISAYALGVVIGAPLIALAAARWPRRRLVLILAAAIALTNLSSALAPSFGSFLLTRLLSGLPHGAYFGTAAVLGASLVDPARRGRAIATTMMGLMIANIAGVPAATWLGQHLGWRSVYLAVAAIGVLTLLGVALLVPAAGPSSGGARGELSALTRAPVLLTLAAIAIGFGGTFAVYSYIAPILTNRSGFTDAGVPVVLAAFGLGMTAGNYVGGRLAERWVLPTIVSCMVGTAAVLAAFAPASLGRVPAVIALFLLGFVVITATPALTTRLMDVAGEGASLAAASYHSAFNIANALGASLGGIVLGAGLGYAAPALVGAALPIVGLVVLWLSVRAEHGVRRARPTEDRTPAAR